MAKVSDVIHQVSNYMDRLKWKHEFRENGNVIVMRAGIESALGPLVMFVTFKETSYLVHIGSMTNVDEKNRPAVMEYITRINYGVLNGNFEMDLKDGEVRYKVYVPTEDLDVIPEKVLQNSLMVPQIVFEKCDNGMATLMKGFSDPETEVKKAESEYK